MRGHHRDNIHPELDVLFLILQSTNFSVIFLLTMRGQQRDNIHSQFDLLFLMLPSTNFPIVIFPLTMREKERVRIQTEFDVLFLMLLATLAFLNFLVNDRLVQLMNLLYLSNLVFAKHKLTLVLVSNIHFSPAQPAILLVYFLTNYSKKILLSHNSTVNQSLAMDFCQNQILLIPKHAKHPLKNLLFDLIFPAFHTSHYDHSLTLPAIAGEFLLFSPLFLNAKLNIDEYNRHRVKYANNYLLFAVDIYPVVECEPLSSLSPTPANRLDVSVLGMQSTNSALNRGINRAIYKLLSHQQESRQVITMLDFENTAKFPLHLDRPYPKVSLPLGD